MIEFQNVDFSYEKDRKVLHDMSFSIGRGESVGLIGANGAGKSTIMKLLLGLLGPDSGKVLIDGIEVKKETLGDIRAKLGFVLQNSDNQMFMPTVYEDMIFGPLNYGLPRAEADRRVDEVLGRLGLEYLKNRYNHKISGGEKRMAAIATILAMEPEAILMDEPTSALDPYNRRIVINTIKGLSHRNDTRHGAGSDTHGRADISARSVQPPHRDQYDKGTPSDQADRLARPRHDTRYLRQGHTHLGRAHRRGRSGA